MATAIILGLANILALGMAIGHWFNLGNMVLTNWAFACIVGVTMVNIGVMLAVAMCDYSDREDDKSNKVDDDIARIRENSIKKQQIEVMQKEIACLKDDVEQLRQRNLPYFHWKYNARYMVFELYVRYRSLGTTQDVNTNIKASEQALQHNGSTELVYEDTNEIIFKTFGGYYSLDKTTKEVEPKMCYSKRGE